MLNKTLPFIFLKIHIDIHVFYCRYIRMHGMKFSKEDHILFIHLLFELVTIPDLEISLVVRYSQMIVTLLK